MNNPKILIMVLSYNESPYKELMQAQQETFDSVEVDGVKTVYYHGLSGGEIGIWVNDTTWWQVQFDCTDAYYFMSKKFQAALEYVKDWDYDLIFRTNSSSYVNKKKLKEFAATLPKEKLYAGWTFKDSEDFGGLCVSGAGIFLSRDTAEILREQIDPNVEREEDVEIGRILRRNGIEAIDDKSRYDVPEFIPAYFPTDRYHYRCKFGGSRMTDAANMKLIHRAIIKTL